MFSRIVNVDNGFLVFGQLSMLRKTAKTNSIFRINVDGSEALPLSLALATSLPGIILLKLAVLFRYLPIKVVFAAGKRLLKSLVHTKRNRVILEKKETAIVVLSHVPLNPKFESIGVGQPLKERYVDYFFSKVLCHPELAETSILYFMTDHFATQSIRLRIERALSNDRCGVHFESDLTEAPDLFSALKKSFQIWYFFARSLLNPSVSGLKTLPFFLALRDASGEKVFGNLLTGIAAQKFFSEVSASSNNLAEGNDFRSVKLLMPFEGRAVEKVFANERGDSPVLGYMHFPISLRHIALRKSAIEERCYGDDVRIFTFGTENAERLKTWCGWGNVQVIGFLKSLPSCGSVERTMPSQELDKICSEQKTTAVPAIPPLRILVLLAMDDDSNENLFQFVKLLAQAANQKLRLEPKFRAHPSLQCPNLFKRMSLEFGLCVDQVPRLEESAKDSDLVMYGETGAALELLELDVPLVHVNDCTLIDNNRLLTVDAHSRPIPSFTDPTLFLNWLLDNLLESPDALLTNWPKLHPPVSRFIQSPPKMSEFFELLKG